MNKPTYEELESQVKQLAAERDAVVAENAALKSAIEFSEPWMPSCDDELLHRTKVAKETPATDAYAASLRAEAIEFAAYHLPSNGKYEDMILALAEEVREGLTEVRIPATKYQNRSKSAESTSDIETIEGGAK